MGYKFTEIIDPYQIDPYDNNNLRKIKITIYYPSSGNKKIDSYGDEQSLFWERELTDVLSAEEISYKEFDSITMDINNLVSFKSFNTLESTGKFPVIIFEHGLCCNCWFLSTNNY